MEQQPKRPAQDFKGKFPNLNADGVDLLQKLLQMDSQQRPTAVDCMKHKYFEGVWDEADLLLYSAKPI